MDSYGNGTGVTGGRKPPLSSRETDAILITKTREGLPLSSLFLTIEIQFAGTEKAML
jgi:hypothetical protein